MLAANLCLRRTLAAHLRKSVRCVSKTCVLRQEQSLQMIEDVVESSANQQRTTQRRIQRRRLARPQINTAESDADWRGVLDESLDRLEMSARDFGTYVLHDLVDDVVTAMEHVPNASISSQKAFLLLRCCGALMCDRTPEQRNGYLDRVMNSLQTRGFGLDISHYNVLLCAYLENDFDFKPTEFLEMLETKNIQPNRVTMKRLLAKYCLDGDTTGAKNFLAAAKENEEVVLSDYVINALIYGHILAGEEQAASDIIESMKGTFEPNADTYGSMLAAHARRGDWPKMTQLFSELEKNGLYLGDEHMHRILAELAKYGHHEHFSEVLDMVQPGPGYGAKAVSLIGQLISKHQAELALKVVAASDSPIAMAVLCDFVFQNSEIPTEVVTKLRTLLANKQHGLAILTRKALEYGYAAKEDLLRDFLKAEDTPPDTKSRVNIYYPLLIQAAQTSDSEGRRILNWMNDQGCFQFLTDWSDFVFPAIEESRSLSESLDFVLDSKIASLRPMTLMSSFILRCLKFNDSSEINTVDNALAKYPDAEIALNSLDMQRRLALVLDRANDSERAIWYKLIDQAWQNATGLLIVRDAIGGLLRFLVRNNSSATDEIVKHFDSKNYRISFDSAEFVRDRLGSNLNDDTDRSLTKMSQRSESIALRSSTKLEEEMENIKDQPEKKPRYNHLVGILHANYTTAGDVPKAESMYEQMEDDLKSDPLVLARMLSCYGKAYNLDKAMEYYDKLYQVSPRYPLYDQTVLKGLAEPMVAEKGVPETLEFLKRHYAKEFDRVATAIDDADSKDRFERLVQMAANGVVEAALRKDDPKGAADLLDFLIKKGDLRPGCRSAGLIIDYYIEKGDIVAAKNRFEEYSEKYRATAGSSALLRHAVAEADKPLLSNIYDRVSSQFGESSALTEMIGVLVSMNKHEQAASLYTKRNTSLMLSKLEWFCRQFMRDRQPENIRAFLTVVKSSRMGLPDQQSIYRYLLSTYVFMNDYKGALDVWMSMQEDGVAATDDMLLRLAQVLENNNQPVPFDKPSQTGTQPFFGRRMNQRARLSPRETVVEF